MKVTFEVDVDLVSDEEWPQRRQEMLRLAKSTEMCSALHAIVQFLDQRVRQQEDRGSGGTARDALVRSIRDEIHGILERRGLLLDEMYS